MKIQSNSIALGIKEIIFSGNECQVWRLDMFQEVKKLGIVGYIYIYIKGFARFNVPILRTNRYQQCLQNICCEGLTQVSFWAELAIEVLSHHPAKFLCQGELENSFPAGDHCMRDLVSAMALDLKTERLLFLSFQVSGVCSHLVKLSLFSVILFISCRLYLFVPMISPI